MARTLLFVYGTLKSGQKNHHFLRGQIFVGPGLTLARYRLWQPSWYPALNEVPGQGSAVHGEVWSVDDDALAAMDEFEGVPDLFVRKEVLIQHHFGDPVYAYFYNGTIPDDTRSESVWPFPS